MLPHASPQHRRISLIAAALSLVGTRGGLAQTTVHRAAHSLEASVDASIAPGDDFFAYANGAWLRATPLPPGMDRWGAREEIAEVSRRRVARLLADAASAPRGTLSRKVADFRAAYADSAAIERRGLAPLRAPFDSIDRVGDRPALARLLGAELRADVDPLNWGVYRSAHPLGLATEHSIHGEKSYSAFLVQGGLGLGDRERYADSSESARALRERYLKYVARQLASAGFDRAERRAAAVLALESDLARTHGSAEASAVDRNADSVWTRAELMTRAPGMDWSAFLHAARLEKLDSFVAWQPTAITGLAALVASQPLESWKDYLRFHAIELRADVLPRVFSDAASAMHDVKSARAERADAATMTALSDAVGRLYVEQYFSAAQKTRVQSIVESVRAAFLKRLESATWLSAGTRAQARTKVRSLYIGIGYPDRWQDYADLTLSATDAARNLDLVAERNYRQALARLAQPFDATEWAMPAHTPGALLIFQQNSYVFSAALLQPPKYDPMASNAAAYGAIGAIIGHDITHYVDVLGADYDTTGRMRHWWTTEDSTRFHSVAQPLVDQFSSYHPLPGVRMNGLLTRSENVADLGGLAAAFDAYRRSLGESAIDGKRLRALDREFFIAYAQSWRSRLSDAALRTRIETNDHAPDRYRAAIVRNLDAWYDAFDVRPGQALFLEPSARVRIW